MRFTFSPTCIQVQVREHNLYRKEHILCVTYMSFTVSPTCVEQPEVREHIL